MIGDVVADTFKRVFNFLANMGLVVRDDPPKVIDMTGREWGEAVDGCALSVREIRKDDPAQLATISVVMKNDGSATKTLTVPGWLYFYAIEVIGPDGTRVGLTPYGSQLLKPERKPPTMSVKLGPGDAIETDLPLATLYNMRQPGPYRVRVSCQLPDGAVLTSNEITVRV
jgi:hypothetical protein